MRVQAEILKKTYAEKQIPQKDCIEKEVPEKACAGKPILQKACLGKKIQWKGRIWKPEDSCRRHKNHSGETLVEVMVSAVIFLLLTAVLQGAITFCTNAQHRSQEIRRRNGEICKSLPTTPAIQDGTASFVFQAASADGTQTGSIPLFQVEVSLEKKEVPYQDTEGTLRTTVFYLFGSSQGGSP